ncbi:translesion DNA synthesis-associated protein ImuA [Alkalilimnicola sp. S0819]|uniref:translesion DNA synthesis-associated protein ImuA n=1 Tax=Alkalilimnicola sp. S0819 TaxID=2613922 RepID=UPI0012629D8C|nr:translesion DNA synthesis-associated protein ImuA [Alkalilimnicola sp. S0819]KAB7627458.1 translesion DNA synthesis-associated protein ImuA [Alkalilimnicola sp. S0819]MPQ15607.1 translesion DNA synthesis-associated protein ImuA [Alkalilimnicola sp. S0819]
MNSAVEELLQQPGIWRANAPARNTGLEHVSSGFDSLDACLPGGGWPLGAVTEILHGQSGIGELRLLMPALVELTRRGRWVALIAPPHIPYAPALAAYGLDLSRLLLVHPRAESDALWAVEQALRAGTCGAVLAWPRRLDERSLRRLQLAAEAGNSWSLLFRDVRSAEQPSPAALRLQLEERKGKTLVQLLKCRGGHAGQHLLLDLERDVRLPATEAPAVEQPVAEKPARRPRRAAPRPLSRPPAPAGTPQLDLPLAGGAPRRGRRR